MEEWKREIVETAVGKIEASVSISSPDELGTVELMVGIETKADVENPTFISVVVRDGRGVRADVSKPRKRSIENCVPALDDNSLDRINVNPRRLRERVAGRGMNEPGGRADAVHDPDMGIGRVVVDREDRPRQKAVTAKEEHVTRAEEDTLDRESSLGDRCTTDRQEGSEAK